MSVVPDDDPVLGEPPSPGGASIATYVSLFLILFVFFIVLFSVARVQHSRTRAVLASLDDAFGHIPSSLGVLPRTPAPVRPGEVFARELGGVLGQFGALNVSAAPAEDGVVLTVDLPVDRLFAAGGTELLPAARPLIDRLAVSLQQPHAAENPNDPPRRYRMVWRVAVPAKDMAPPKPGPAEIQTADTTDLELARGAAFAAALYDRGCPANAIAIRRVTGVGAEAAGLSWRFVLLDPPRAPGNEGN